MGGIGGGEGELAVFLAEELCLGAEVLIGGLFCVEGGSGDAVDAAVGEAIAEVAVGVDVLCSDNAVCGFDGDHLLDFS